MPSPLRSACAPGVPSRPGSVTGAASQAARLPQAAPAGQRLGWRRDEVNLYLHDLPVVEPDERCDGCGPAGVAACRTITLTCGRPGRDRRIPCVGSRGSAPIGTMSQALLDWSSSIHLQSDTARSARPAAADLLRKRTNSTVSAGPPDRRRNYLAFCCLRCSARTSSATPRAIRTTRTSKSGQVLEVVTASTPAPAKRTAAATRIRAIEVNDGRPWCPTCGCPVWPFACGAPLTTNGPARQGAGRSRRWLPAGHPPIGITCSRSGKRWLTGPTTATWSPPGWPAAD